MYTKMKYSLHLGAGEQTLCQWLAALTGSVSVVLSLAWGRAMPRYEAVQKTGKKDLTLRLRPNVRLVQLMEVQVFVELGVVFSGGQPTGLGEARQRWATLGSYVLPRA